MTIGEFAKIIKAYNIPDDVTMLSDSGWECGPTDMEGLYYNERSKKLVFTQKGNEYERYFDDPEWRLIHSEEV